MDYTSQWRYTVFQEFTLKKKENKLVDSDCFQAVVFKRLVICFLAFTASHKRFSWFIKEINVKSIMAFKNSPNISHPKKVSFRVLLMIQQSGKNTALTLKADKRESSTDGKCIEELCFWEHQEQGRSACTLTWTNSTCKSPLLEHVAWMLHWPS